MKTIFKSFLVLCLALSFNSCEQVIDLEPTDIITATGINDLSAADQLIIGAYGIMPDLTLISLGEIATDNTQLAPTNTGQGVFTHNWTYNAQFNSGQWIGYYNAINSANTVLAAIDNIEITAAEQGLKDQLKGEAMAIRGYAHWRLLDVYAQSQYGGGDAGIPIIDAPAESSQKPARNTAGEVLAFSKADLTTALGLVPSGIFDVDRFGSAAVNAVLAKIAMVESDWPGAMTAAGNAISQSGTSIANDADYLSMWSDLGNSEVIWKRSRTTNQFISAFKRAGNNDIFYNAAPSLQAMYAADDIRSTVNFVADGTDWLVNKYTWTSPANAADVKIFRTSEMALIRAEAAAMQNMLGAAAAEVDAIRAMRIDSHVANSTSYASQADALTDIHLERRKELAFEGQRFFDMKRLGMGFTRPASDCILASSCALPAGSPLFAHPIPENELNGNPNMVQNPGY